MSDTIYDTVYDALSGNEHQYPVIKEGTVSEDKLPETYITYVNYYDEAGFYADNKPVDEVYTLRINLYSRDPSIAQDAINILNTVLLPAGFIKLAGGRDLPYSKTTQHHGYSCDYEYYKEK